MTSLADLDKARIALGVYLDKREFIDAVLAPLRGRVPDGSPGLAPVWAAYLVRRMASLFFDEMSWANLHLLTRRLVETEELAAAAQTVLLSFFPNRSMTGEHDGSLTYSEATKLWAELEKVAWA